MVISDCRERLLEQDIIDHIDVAKLPAKICFESNIDYGFHYLHSGPPPHKHGTLIVLLCPWKLPPIKRRDCIIIRCQSQARSQGVRVQRTASNLPKVHF